MRNLFEKIKYFARAIFCIKRQDNHVRVNFLGLRLSFRRLSKIPWPTVTERGVSDSAEHPRVVASLTSIPKRIATLPKVISALLSQKRKPDMLVLWLAKENFPNMEKELPDELLQLQEFGLTIKWCSDIKSYKKLVPSLREYPDDIVITFDDDMYYAPDVIENLMASYAKYPDAIHCYRAGRVHVPEGSKIVPVHNNVIMRADYTRPSFLNVIMSGTGTLFPPHSLHKDVLDENIFMKFLPTNDEIFFWGMAVLNGTKITNVKSFNYNMRYIKSAQKYALSNINRTGMAGVDGKTALNMVAQKYPKIIETLKTEDENE